MIPGVQVALVIGGTITVMIGVIACDFLYNIFRQLKRMNDLEEKAQKPLIQVVDKTPDRVDDTLEDFKKKWRYQFEAPMSEDEKTLEKALRAGHLTKSGIGFPTTDRPGYIDNRITNIS